MLSPYQQIFGPGVWNVCGSLSLLPLLTRCVCSHRFLKPANACLEEPICRDATMKLCLSSSGCCSAKMMIFWRSPESGRTMWPGGSDLLGKVVPEPGDMAQQVGQQRLLAGMGSALLTGQIPRWIRRNIRLVSTPSHRPSGECARSGPFRQRPSQLIRSIGAYPSRQAVQCSHSPRHG